MSREKIKMKKIENTAARHVTFSKRRRGLFKKAQELATLCDVQVALIVFSSTGKLYDFSTTSIKEIVEMHNRSLGEKNKAERSSIELQPNNIDSDIREGKMKEMDQQLRLLQGKDIEGSTLNDLVLLEKNLEKGLCHVLKRKGQMIMGEIRGLQQKRAELTEQNELLRQEVLEMTKGKRDVELPEPVQISQDDIRFSGSVTSTSTPDATQDIEDHSDTHLTLGLPFSKT